MSPIFIIFIVHWIASISYQYIPDYCWMITAASYWGLTGLIKLLFVPAEVYKDWLKKPVFIKKWLLFGLLIGIFPAVGILLPNVNLLLEYPHITLFLLLFALINPWFEEGYWRGLLLDAGESFPRRVTIMYSTLLFVLSHPFMWGVFSIANRSYQMYISLVVMGIIWSLIRYRTSSLRWSVYSHMLVDVGNLSVFVFLNLYIPPGMS
ncbi:CPBP family intramembrane glutamic endopeptidase [Bacillus sp. JJ1532]|uniref:CPBP family intramembrane glutamic endopeptidase n=1 Tax=Bacillus sp. JJ1532 TaxID=3122958 RepID=UPI002FFF1633